MSEFEAEVKKAEQELEQSLIPMESEIKDESADDEFLGDLRMHAQEYGEKIHDAAAKARDFATEKLNQASDKFKELQGREPSEIVEEAKEFARKKPGQAILISAALGLLVGLFIRGRK